MQKAFQFCIAMSLFAVVQAIADKLPEEDETTAEEIVVTATRIPTPFRETLPSTAIITAEDIELLKPKDIGQLLTLKSGLSFRDSGGRGTSGDLFIRGTQGDHVLVLIDGVRTASATTGATALQRIPLSSIERIEIVKGPVSGIYGSDAIGGVVQIFTKQQRQQGASGSIEVASGTDNMRRHTAQVGFGEEDFSVFALVSKESTDGIDRTHFKGGGNEDKDGFKSASGNLSFKAALQENLEFQLNRFQSAGRVDYDNTSDFGSENNKTNKGRNWHLRNELSTTSAQIDYQHSENLNIKVSIGRGTDFNEDFRPDRTSSRRTHFKTSKTDYSLQANLILSAQDQVSGGIDYQKDEVDSTTPYAKTKRSSEGYFLLWQRQGDRTGTVFNVRYDDFGSFGNTTNYSLQQSFKLTEEYQVVVGHGTAFKAPTMNDLYWPGSGNPDLEPEKSKSFELSLRADYGDAFWQINAYQTKVRNLISWSGTSPSNINKTTMEGVEIEGSKNWSDYFVRAGLDYLEAKDDKTGGFLDDRARASGSFEFGRQVEKVYFGIDAFFEHARFGLGEKLPGYSIWGINGQYEASDALLFSARIRNLFDKEYITNLASSDNPYQNEGRTIEVALEYRF